MSVTATLISDKPIKVMMVPVTTGVISLRSLPMNWLSTTSINAAKKQMPKIVERISSVPPPRALTMNPALKITLIKEKLVPCRHNSPEPTGPKVRACTKVPSPDTNSAMLTRYGTSLSSPSTPPTIRVGVMMPTKLANTCCNAAKIAAVKCGRSSRPYMRSDL